jgi:hypothetical protein
MRSISLHAVSFRLVNKNFQLDLRPSIRIYFAAACEVSETDMQIKLIAGAIARGIVHEEYYVRMFTVLSKNLR